MRRPLGSPTSSAQTVSKGAGISTGRKRRHVTLEENVVLHAANSRRDEVARLWQTKKLTAGRGAAYPCLGTGIDYPSNPPRSASLRAQLHWLARRLHRNHPDRGIGRELRAVAQLAPRALGATPKNGGRSGFGASNHSSPSARPPQQPLEKQS